MKKGFDYKVEAIILVSTEIKEYDRIYSVFSLERGFQKVIGIGIRKIGARLASGMEPLTWSDLTLIKCKTLDRTRAVVIRDQFISLKKNLKVVIKLRRLATILSRTLTDQEPVKELYFFLIKLLLFANKSLKKQAFEEGKFEQLYLAMLWKTLYFGGFQPQLYGCSFCGNQKLDQKNIFFNSTEGVICFDCKIKTVNHCIKLSVDCLKVLRLFCQKDFDFCFKIKISKEVIFEIKKITRVVLEDFLNQRVLL